MKVWTVILAGVILAALPNLGNSALEDAGVVVANDYNEFEKRVFRANTPLICTNENAYEWFQIKTFESMLLDFENGRNNMGAKFRLGTPAILLAGIRNDKFYFGTYCKYLPKQFQGPVELYSDTASKQMMYYPWEYYAVKINDMEPATITMGFNKIRTLVKNRLSIGPPNTDSALIVEKTAAGVIYVGEIRRLEE